MEFRQARVLAQKFELPEATPIVGDERGELRQGPCRKDAFFLIDSTRTGGIGDKQVGVGENDVAVDELKLGVKVHP